MNLIRWLPTIEIPSLFLAGVSLIFVIGFFVSLIYAMRCGKSLQLGRHLIWQAKDIAPKPNDKPVARAARRSKTRKP